MIRYNKTITFRRTVAGQITITGDRMAVSYKTTAINGYEYIRRWWEMQHHSTLREYQKDLLVKLVPSAFKDIDWRYEHTPYVIWAEGSGYNQPHDMALVTLTHPEHEKNIYLFSTAEHTWLHQESKRADKFSIHTDDALCEGLDSPQAQNTIWDLYDGIRKQAEEAA